MNASETTDHMVQRQDYQAPDYWIDRVNLVFELGAECSKIRCCIEGRRREGVSADRPLWLDGDGQPLLFASLDGAELTPDRIQLEKNGLSVFGVGEHFRLLTETEVHPSANTALSGLYQSGAMLCTQCEAEGFRKITCFPDRPDVLARYTTVLIADEARYPALLSNGNLISSGRYGDGRHWCCWQDPFPKPSYLFALVAGDLASVHDVWLSGSGKRVSIGFYVEHGNESRCDHAMMALKNAMTWDEQRFGLICDLDVYNVVAVGSFNMGAMENKGLNLFNAACVLASPDVASDADYARIEAVVGHEYFHNWTGNRVTCRDWFQLSLKEGLTVFREQGFVADMGGGDLRRIEDVEYLMTVQFAEDAGPTAHPVRPDHYRSIDNFYTPTIYEKGAEIIRMMETMVGRDGFERGLALYISRHDGTAATVEDLIAAIGDANQMDLSGFLTWYGQAGTPVLQVSGDYDGEAKTLTLQLKQQLPPCSGSESVFVPIPVRLALWNAAGERMPLQIADGSVMNRETDPSLLLVNGAQQWIFEQVAEPPLLSLLRGYSAPVKLDCNESAHDDLALLRCEDDAVTRWQAGRRLMMNAFDRVWADSENDSIMEVWLEAVRWCLSQSDMQDTLMTRVLTWPGFDELRQRYVTPDPLRLESVRRRFACLTAIPGLTQWQNVYRTRHHPGEPYRYERSAIGARSLKNCALEYLGLIPGYRAEAAELCRLQYEQAQHLTDRMGALQVWSKIDADQANAAIEDLARRWGDDDLVMDKCFSLWARAWRPRQLAYAERLLSHPRFTWGKPNRVRALIGGIAHHNPEAFHAVDGGGYRFLADAVVRLGALNPQLASRLVGALAPWAEFSEPHASLMRQQLEFIEARVDGAQVQEMVRRALHQDQADC